MVAIVAGAVVLSWPGEVRFSSFWPALAILGACFAWAIDNIRRLHVEVLLEANQGHEGVR